MKFGLNDQEYKFIITTLKSKLPSGVSVWIFGSRARGNHNKLSDIDLMLESELGSISNKQRSELDEVFCESNLIFKVDIVERSNFAKSYVDNYLAERKLLVKT